MSLHCCHGWSDNMMWLGKSDRSEQHMFWCCGVMSLVDYSSQLRRKGKSVPISPNPADKATHELTYTSFRNCCGCCVRARSQTRSTSQTTTQRALSTCKHCKEEASPFQKYGSSRSKQRALYESCRTSTKQVL